MHPKRKKDPLYKCFILDLESLIYLEKGRVFMFGSNNWGQLGLGHENNIDKPSCVKCKRNFSLQLIELF